MATTRSDHNPAHQFLHIVQHAARSLESGAQGIQKHLTQAAGSLPFAYVAGIKALQPGVPGPMHQFTLALAPTAPTAAPTATAPPAKPKKTKRQPTVHPHDARTVCVEFTKGKRRLYKRTVTSDGQPTLTHSGFEIADDEVQHHTRVRDALADYLLPQGYPDSVAPQYPLYMGWRGVQYFFGGAMSVFTTKSLLGALGVANRHSGEAAAAINWVVKDGAGRLGRFLFARWGRSLDCELKQFRLAGDFLMEAGAALELSTILAPRAFLPLACTANLAKNLAAVAASSTRAPIYRNFARQNNLADITAKGESVANLADILGTTFGIILAKANLPIVPTFVILSAGYLVASRREVDSVELPYLNRARLSYAARAFLDTGRLPSPKEANMKEALLPWNDPAAGRIVLGATVAEACTGPEHLDAALTAFKGRQYAITYRPDSRKIYILLKDGVRTPDILAAALDAHAVLYMLEHSSWHKAGARRVNSGTETGSLRAGTGAGRLVARFQRLAETSGQQAGKVDGHDAIVAFVASNGAELRRVFEAEANAGGWKLPLTMLNPSDTRLGL